MHGKGNVRILSKLWTGFFFLILVFFGVGIANIEGAGKASFKIYYLYICVLFQSFAMKICLYIIE